MTTEERNALEDRLQSFFLEGTPIKLAGNTNEALDLAWRANVLEYLGIITDQLASIINFGVDQHPG